MEWVKIMPMDTRIPQINFRKMYDRFDSPITAVDCGLMCAPYNPLGKPFCCDICQAVPALYDQEWDYLQENTKLWKQWQGTECPEGKDRIEELLASTPENMILGACLGPQKCQRGFRAVSCRQFPFFPYITEDYRFIGLAYEWAFEESCWVINHLDEVLPEYRREFIATYDALFDQWPNEMDSYADLSAEMREDFIQQKRRIPILHRNGQNYLLSPASDKLAKTDLSSYRKFGYYREQIIP
jgi:hypothetical protein